MTAPEPEASAPRRRIPPAVWMSALAVSFLLIGVVAAVVPASIRYGAGFGHIAGGQAPSAPLAGAWKLSERAPAQKGLAWRFDGDGWTETPSGIANVKKFYNDEQCVLVLEATPVPASILALGSDEASSKRYIGSEMAGMRRVGAKVTDRGLTRPAWIAVDSGKVEFAGNEVEMTPGDSTKPYTGFIYVHSFNASQQLAAVLIECPDGIFEVDPTLLGNTLAAVSLSR